MKFPADFFLETKRFNLRLPNEADIPRVFSASRVKGFNDGMRWEPPETIEELYPPLQRSIEYWKSDKAYNFSIDDKISGEFLGRVGVRLEGNNWSVGFWTHPDHQGKGVMTESLAEILKFGFEELKLKRIEACYALWNKSSEKVLKANGMKFFRHIKKGYQKRGNWVEVNLVVITKKDWLDSL